ncbi:MAG: efflux RND transporter periplasmic adaptor subunit [Acidobacteriia bacterium]|nr:efflux RND transporter periplasmic adaptor subunit [Terriglobia bacterium]
MKKVVYGLLSALLLGGAFLAGSWHYRRISGKPDPPGSRRILYYVDPMHPAYKSDKPGNAPDCGMPLEPVYADGAPGSDSSEQASASMPPGSARVSPERQQVIGVRVATAERVSGTRAIRLVGRVTMDENRIYRLITPTDGWVRALRGGTTGSLVENDQVLATYYSRDLLAGEQALFFAVNTLERYKTAEGSENQVSAANIQIKAAEANLMALGMSATQLQEIERSRTPAQEIEVRAPVKGFVVARNIFPNLRFERNFELYRITDLSHVWVVADVFETEARDIRPGVTAVVKPPGEPDEKITARVSDVLPQFDAATRTFKVRLEVDNPAYVLRPEMFVDVEMSVYMPATLVVPADALVDSGLRKTVFVDRGNGFFEPRTVETGWRFDNRVEIRSGLNAGERIVVSGTFLIDSESRMKAAATGIYGEAARDPVCGMDIDLSKAIAAGRKTDFQGKTYYFCSDDCEQKFNKNPKQYAEKAPAKAAIKGK